MNVKIKKGRARGTVPAPPSKSMAHRMLIAAALSEGSTVSGVALSEDIKATIGALEKMGAAVKEVAPGKYTAGGLLPENIPECEVNCSESGSTLRFTLPLCLLSDKKVTLTGTKKLISRPLGVYEKLCRDSGLYFSKSEDSVTVKGPLKSGRYMISMNESSQFVTGLMFALSTLDEDSFIEIEGTPESLSYVDLTIETMRLFGVNVEKNENGWRIPGGEKYRPQDCAVEGDCSNAAFLEAFNVLGGDVTVTGISKTTAQGDRVYAEYFEKIKRGETCDLADCPDLAPVLFGIAACLGGGKFTGTRRLHLKESDRVLAMKEELAKFGVTVTEEENSVTVGSEKVKAPSEPLSSHNDHRIAMTMALLCTLTGGEIVGAEAVKKSYPDFFERIGTLGIEVERIDT